ncbi:MAG: T9SS type A sorting domain-containing protein [Bacteroidia bacterium]|nr:T9SS type A sorting domain-containing protein [Bacteroidia bacterium]
MIKKLLALSSLFVSTALLAQNTQQNYWTPLNERSIELTGKRQIVPQKYLTYGGNSGQIKNLLFSAPNEQRTSINLSSAIINLPLPNGSFQRFRVVNSPVMAEELAAAFPNIQTYSIKGIDDPYASGKLDWNEFGFHAMVLSPNGNFFIDPYCVGNINSYITYYTADFIKAASDILPENGVEGTENGQKKPGANTAPTGLNNRPSVAPAICVGANLKKYRLAIACTGEYAVAATGLSAPTVAQTLAKIVTTVNRVDGVYETEVSVRLELVSTETLVVYTNATTDPFTGNNNANTLIGQSQSVISASIGTSNFDIGHTFSTGGGGLAYLGCVCNSSNKARGITGSPNPVGDPYDIDYVAHEMGHQFGGSHTFNAGTGSCNGNRNASTSVEPGSGITIMGYAGICGSVDNLGSNSIPYFHAVSYDQIVNFINNNGSGGSCAVTLTTGNQPPVVNAPSSYVVPVYTPFSLTGSATDPNGDALTYSWEETDPGASTSSWNTGAKPYFMSYAPSTNPTRFFPKASIVATGNYTITRGEFLPTTAQTLNFRLTARDNKMGGGGVCYSNVSLAIDASGPFKVTYPSAFGILWNSSSSQNITWDVNGTNQVPVSCDSVRVLISYNSGNAYSVLIGSTPNDGIETITVPVVTGTIVTCRIKIEAKGNVFYDIGDNNFTIANNPNADVAISEVSKNNALGLSVWPNPANESLNVVLGNLNPGNETIIEVVDMLGKSLIKNNYNNKAYLKENINVGSLSSGVYFIKVSNNNLNSAYRFVKQ